MLNRKNEVVLISRTRYYCLGLAQGLLLIYDFMNEYENRNFTTKEWKETIKYVALDRKSVV